MKPKKITDLCPLCGGNKKAGTTTFTAELGTGVVAVRNVPVQSVDSAEPTGSTIAWLNVSKRL